MQQHQFLQSHTSYQINQAAYQSQQIIKGRIYKYEKLSDSKIIQEKNCLSFIFNTNSTLLFIGFTGGNIVLYNFFNLKKIVQTLKYHTNDACCLLWVKSTDQLISGSCDTSIILWNIDQNNTWKPLQILQGHSDQINCIVLNFQENLLISGYDQTIKFWSKANDLQWKQYQIVDTQYRVYSLSLNFSQQKLISCGSRNVISVIENQSIQKWIIIQTIIVDNIGYRICFINDDQFIYKPKSNADLEIYKYQKEINQFIQSEQILVQAHSIQTERQIYFQCQFIQHQNLFIVKNDQNQNFELQLQVGFNTDFLFGKLTDDAQFLVTWDGDHWFSNDKGSKEIQFRRIKCLY